jgi:hypothetical protein
MCAGVAQYKCERFALQFALLPVHRQGASLLNDLIKIQMTAKMTVRVMLWVLCMLINTLL